LASERERVEEQLDRLRDTDVDAECPTCDQPLDEEHRSEAIEKREERISEIKTKRAALTEELDGLREEYDVKQ
jgi:exonuclease SbcC